MLLFNILIKTYIIILCHSFIVTGVLIFGIQYLISLIILCFVFHAVKLLFLEFKTKYSLEGVHDIEKVKSLSFRVYRRLGERLTGDSRGKTEGPSCFWFQETENWTLIQQQGYILPQIILNAGVRLALNWVSSVDHK